MKNQLVIKEKYSKYWPIVAALSAVLCILFFFGYQFAGDVLTEGYLRLTSFAFFAISLLSLFKIWDGQIVISVHPVKNDALEFIYTVRGQTIAEERLSFKELENLKIDQMPNKSIYNDFKKSDSCIRFRRENTSDWLYLNKVNGRVIPLSKQNAEEMHQFIKNASQKS